MLLNAKIKRSSHRERPDLICILKDGQGWRGRGAGVCSRDRHNIGTALRPDKCHSSRDREKTCQPELHVGKLGEE
jgi:hypothetical protein